MVARLLELGADTEVMGDNGKLPLHFACWHGRTAALALLLDAGASLNRRDGFFHKTALCKADLFVELLQFLVPRWDPARKGEPLGRYFEKVEDCGFKGSRGFRGCELARRAWTSDSEDESENDN